MTAGRGPTGAEIVGVSFDTTAVSTQNPAPHRQREPRSKGRSFLCENAGKGSITGYGDDAHRPRDEQLAELRSAADTYSARHQFIRDLTWPEGIRIAVNFTCDFDAMLLRRLLNEPPMQLAKGEFRGRVAARRAVRKPTPPARIYASNRVSGLSRRP